MREPVFSTIVEALRSLCPPLAAAVVVLLVQEEAHHEELHLRLAGHDRRDAAVKAVAKYPPHARSSLWILPDPRS